MSGSLHIAFPSHIHVLITFSLYPSLTHKVNLLHIEESVEQAVELVRRSALTQMDGRDLARVLALESSNDTHCYTVSLERGAVYAPRHTSANFNRPTFCTELQERYGHDIKFRQIILDYFWIPPGTWQKTHWKSTFFGTTIPNFVRQGLLDFNPGVCDEHDVDQFSTSGKGGGVVYLPFCLHCVQQILASYDILSKYYTIEFINKHQLKDNALFAATSTIDSNVMQNWLGKALNQEDVYCTITPSEVYGSSIDSNVTKEEILGLLRRIENFYNVRMIKLKALQMYDPKFVVNSKTTIGKKKKRKIIGVDRGGFVGLKRKGAAVKNGFDQKDTGKNNTTNPQGSSNRSKNIIVKIKSDVLEKQQYDAGNDEETGDYQVHSIDDKEYAAAFDHIKKMVSSKPIFCKSAKSPKNEDNRTFRSISKTESEVVAGSKDMMISLEPEESRSYKTPDLTSVENTCDDCKLTMADCELYNGFCVEAVKHYLEKNPACKDRNKAQEVFVEHYRQSLKFRTYETTGKFAEANSKDLPHCFERSMSDTLSLVEKQKDL